MQECVYVYNSKNFELLNLHFPCIEELADQKVLQFQERVGYKKYSYLKIGAIKDFPEFEVFEKEYDSPVTLIYPFFSYLSLTQSDAEIVLFTSHIDLLNFLKEYSNAFKLLIENFSAQTAWEKDDG